MKCPWPEDIFTVTDKEYVKAIPDELLRTRISGFLMRKGWKIAKEDISKIVRHEIEELLDKLK
jgi:hypothetical protein